MMDIQQNLDTYNKLNMKSLKDTITEALNVSEAKLPKLKEGWMITWDEDGETVSGEIQTIKRDKVHVSRDGMEIDHNFDFMIGDEFHQKLTVVEVH